MPQALLRAFLLVFGMMHMAGCASTDILIRSVVPPEEVESTRATFKDLEQNFFTRNGELIIYEENLWKTFPFLKKDKAPSLKLENKKPSEIQRPIEVYYGEAALEKWTLGRPTFATNPPVEKIGFTTIEKADLVRLKLLICPLNVVIHHKPGTLNNYFKGVDEPVTGNTSTLYFIFLRESGNKARLIALREDINTPAQQNLTKNNIWDRTVNGLSDTFFGVGKAAVNALSPKP